MTTHELIRQLSTMPGDMPVLICQEGITFEPGGGVGAADYLTPIVHVEVAHTVEAVDRLVDRHRQPAGGINSGAVLIHLPH